MEYQSFGRTGVPVSKLCLGCMNFGWKTAESEAFDIVDRAIDSGINFFDTANVYGRGASETIVGKALKRNGKRDQIILATKVHGRMDDDDVLAAGSSRRHIIQQCEASLKRLQTDTIDLYQLHRAHPEIPIDETLRALDDLIRAGKVRYIGSSNFPAWRIMESLWVAKELGLNRFVSEQPPYHLLDRSVERELVPLAESYSLAILPWSPLARGFLSGKYQRGQSFPGDARLADDLEGDEQSPFTKRGHKHFKERAYDLLSIVEALAAEKNCTPSQVAVAWLLHQPGVTSVIVGPRTVGQLDDYLGALTVEISDDDGRRLDEVSEPELAIVPYYHGSMLNFGPSKYR